MSQQTEGSDWMQESRECTELKITSKRSSSWFSRETGVWLSIGDVTSCPSTNPAVIKHVNRQGNGKKNTKKETKPKKMGIMHGRPLRCANRSPAIGCSLLIHSPGNEAA